MKPPRTPEHYLAIISYIYELTHGLNKQDRANVGIEVSIERGFDTQSEIIFILRHLGVLPSHIAVVLKKGAGGPDRHRWQRDEKGVYSLHPVAEPGDLVQ